MNTIVLYHNPRCSKSRQALKLLRQGEASVEVVEYLDQPLDALEIEALLGKLQVAPASLVRHKEAEYAQSGLDQASDAVAVAAALSRWPKLMERPVAVRGERAVIGRPPERVLELL